MVQPYNRVNATSGDYRGSKAVLGERVIEGLENYGNLTSDLQLTYDTPKNVLIETVNNFKVILPRATDLIKGWTVFIINEDSTSNLTVAQYSSTEEKSIFNEVESTKMIQCMLIDNSTEEGVWKLLTTGEFGATELEKRYVTSVYEKNIISYGELNVGTTYTKKLIDIPATTPVKSVFVKPLEKFEGVDIYLNVGTEEEPNKFVSDLKISSEIAEENYKKDLFEEILSTTEDKNLIATVFTKIGTGDDWVSANYGSYNYTNSFYNNGIYYFISEEGTVVSTANLKDFEEHLITSFDYNPQSIIFENGNFYIVCKKEDKFSIAKTSDFNNFQFFNTIHNISEAPSFFVKCGENYIVTLTNYVFSTKYIENIDSWNIVQNDALQNINKVSASDDLCVITCNDYYFTTEDGISLSQNVSDEKIYDYLDHKWLRYELGNTENTIIEYSEDFSRWIEKDTQTFNILDIKFLNNIWFIFTDIAQYTDKSLTISRDFFDNIARVDTKFGINNVQSICGLPSQTVVVGENGSISYSSGNDFFSLTSGKVEIVIEKVKEINPQTIKNPIINTQVPIGSIFNYPFSDVPSGYFRLDGGTIPNARVLFPKFIEKIEATFNEGFKNVLITNEQYNRLTEEEKNNCGSFSWTDDNRKSELRLPKINCFIRGVGDSGNLQTIKDLTGIYQTDTVRAFEGLFTSFDRHDRGQYTPPFSVAERWSTGVRSGSDDYWGSRVKMATSTLGEHFSGSETQPKHVIYPYIISVYSGVQETAELNLKSINDILNKNQEILQQGYEQLTRIQGEKSNITRQCVTIAPNTNYVRSQNGLNVVCDANVFGTNAQGFVNGIPFDIQIKSESTLTFTLPANSTGTLYLKKDLESNTIGLDYTKKWIVSSSRPNLEFNDIWYDTINEKLFVYQNGSLSPFYAVKIAEFETSTTSITKLNIEKFRYPGKKGFGEWENVASTGTTTEDGILVVYSGNNRPVYISIDGITRINIAPRDRYGQGPESCCCPIAKGSSWSITGGENGIFFIPLYSYFKGADY